MGSLYTETKTQGRRTFDDGGRDWLDGAASRGMALIAGDQQKLG